MRWFTARARCSAKMPGDDWQKFANLRLLFGYMFTPAGQEAAVHGRRDRRSGASGTTTAASTGTLLGWPAPWGVQRWVRDLNAFYRREPALYETDFDPRWLALDRCRRFRSQRADLHALTQGWQRLRW